MSYLLCPCCQHVPYIHTFCRAELFLDWLGTRVGRKTAELELALVPENPALVTQVWKLYDCQAQNISERWLKAELELALVPENPGLMGQVGNCYDWHEYKLPNIVAASEQGAACGMGPEASKSAHSVRF